MHQLRTLVVAFALGGCSFAGARVHRPVSADASCSSVRPKIDLAVAIAMALPFVIIQFDSSCREDCNFDSRRFLTQTVGLPTLGVSLTSLLSAAHGHDVTVACRRERALARSRR